MAKPEIEKRKHGRVSFPATERPVFKSRGHAFEIKDLSLGGLKFSHENKIRIRGWVHGTIKLPDGTGIDVEGVIVRVDNRDMGLSFIGRLDDSAYRRITLSFRIANS